jgi:hypothetical protein
MMFQPQNARMAQPIWRLTFNRVSQRQPWLRMVLRLAREAWLKAALFGRLEHGLEVIVIGEAAEWLIKQAIIAGDGVLTITLQQGQQIDTADDTMMFTGPMAVHQFDLLGIQLVKRGIVEDQQAVVAIVMLLGFVPEWCSIGLQTV